MTADSAGEKAGPLRTMVLALMLLGMVGLAAELLLLEHTESVWQWVPLVALACGFLLGAAAWVRPGPGVLRALQGVMAAFVAAGLLGVFLHYQGNAEFELESDPALRGFALLWESLHGATPALAPGALAQLGLLGLAFTYRHPALRHRSAAAGDLAS